MSESDKKIPSSEPQAPLSASQPQLENIETTTRQ